MMKFKIQRLRKSIHSLSLMSIILGSFGLITVAGTCYMSIGYFRLICPVGFIELSLATRSINLELLIPFVTMTFLLFFMGRSFCSWGCPASYMGGLVRKIITNSFYKKYLLFKLKIQNYIPQPGTDDVIAMMIGTLVGIYVFQFPLPCTFCPLGVISRSIIEIANHSTVAHFSIALRYDIVLLLIPISAMILFTRGWSQICPVGSFKGFLSKFNKTFVPFTTIKCVECRLCEQSCPVHIGPRQGLPDMSICIKCMLCVDNCPSDAIDILSIYKNKVKNSKIKVKNSKIKFEKENTLKGADNSL